jgi:hypothetical protein
MPPGDYAAIRSDRRKLLTEIKRRRRPEIGPFATFYFENYETMRHQVQEMLHIERGGDAQIEDELAAYNPLIPQGKELVATVMFEIDDPARRAAVLARLGGIEDHAFLDIAGQRVRGEPDPTRENTSPEGKASSVQFLRFPFTDDQVARFKTPRARVSITRITGIWRCCRKRYAPHSQKISIKPSHELRYSRHTGVGRCRFQT